MNQKLVMEFSNKLGTINKKLIFRVTEKGSVQIKYNDDIICTLMVVYDVPLIIIELDQAIVLTKETSALYGDLLKVCGEYLEAFFGDDE